MHIIHVLLIVIAVYCAGMWLALAARSVRTGENLETETFHLGLCLILALGFLYLGGQ
jgi:hypothetical protein